MQWFSSLSSSLNNDSVFVADFGFVFPQGKIATDKLKLSALQKVVLAF
jgi:hypothetical protein